MRTEATPDRGRRHELGLTRRDLLKGAAALPLLACAARRPPDVLFIVADDLNDWVGCLGGHPQAHTPNIDRLASRGMLFREAQAPAPGCNPSRTSVFTGIPAHEHGIYGNGMRFRRWLPEALTLPQLLRRHGYEALGGGKLFHATRDRQSWSEVFVPAVQMTGPLPGNGPSRAFDWGPLELRPEETSDGLLVGWAASQLREPRRAPLFLAVGLSRPHLPWFAPREFFDRFPVEDVRLPAVREGDLADVPRLARRFASPRPYDHATILERGLWQQAVAAYLANVAFLDWSVGELLDAFDARSGGEGIVVFWSDHGFHLGEKQHWRKWTLWRESTRVPLVFAAPGRIEAGRTCDRPVTLAAIGSTLAELCGIEEAWGTVPSLGRLLSDPEAEGSPPAVVGLHANGAVCAGTWRYIRYFNGSEELYDERVDPGEWTNLASSPAHQDRKAELAALMPRLNVVDRAAGDHEASPPADEDEDEDAADGEDEDAATGRSPAT